MKKDKALAKKQDLEIPEQLIER